MFDWTIRAGDLILGIQTLAIIFGFYFSVQTIRDTKSTISLASENLRMAGNSLRESTANDQAQLYNQMVIQGRDLIYKHIEVYHSGDTPEDRKSRQNLYTGSVLSYYASCFGLRSILALPESVTKLLDAELKSLMGEPAVSKRYSELKGGYSKEFNKHVSDLTGGV